MIRELENVFVESNNEYFVNATVAFFTDNHYGADSDGNRGVSRDFAELIDCMIEDKEGNDVTNVMYNKLETQINDWLDNYEEYNY